MPIIPATQEAEGRGSQIPGCGQEIRSGIREKPSLSMKTFGGNVTDHLKERLCQDLSADSSVSGNIIMHLEVVVLSLILLLTDAVVSYTQVSGVVGHRVIIPCSYSVTSGVTSMCWGRGACPTSKCSNELIWTDGSQVTFQKHRRYKLEGNLLQGNVSLTIENAAKTDSGLYCCRIEHSGWFNDMKLTLSLEIKPVATLPTTTQAAETQTKTLQETRTSSASLPLYYCPTDGNSTMTQSSDGLWQNNETQVFPAQSPGMTNGGLYVGITISTLVLLAVLIVIIIKKYFLFRKKMQPLSMASLTGPQIGVLQSEANARARAEDNVYIIEDNLYVME
ncbi:hepatitis A virus cellular receptor 1 isoform X4 [Marmota marmota marmota]|uniref:hepatitis A virus cellular receptor 1 isoform X4 n=2 Tax=Marmota TaxID=9992 RepID=UPI00209255CC|nr:hepatitis A virus cellular receptor 1 isoform X4 [Marmota marmota marmota]